jgi:hypothetical protein
VRVAVTVGVAVIVSVVMVMVCESRPLMNEVLKVREVPEVLKVIPSRTLSTSSASSTLCT